MNLLDKITETEYDMLDDYRYFYSGILNSRFDNHAKPVRDVLTYWEKAKQALYKVLGNNLIISKDFEYNKSSSDMCDEIDKIKQKETHLGREGRNGYEFYEAFHALILENYMPNLSSFALVPHEERKKDAEYQHLSHLRTIGFALKSLTDSQTLLDNEYCGSTFELNLPNNKKLTISKGCKPLKILGKIAEYFNLPGFEDFRISHSLVLNQKKLKGKITLSIHPLDYWTMSDNDCDWDSCMNWKNDGCYRRGTVEMMNSPVVVVAYLSNPNRPMLIGSNNWSNKKWRQLFIVSKDLIMGIKDYPYHNDELGMVACNWIKELAKKNMGWTYVEDAINPNLPYIFEYSLNPFYVPQTGTLVNFEFYTDKAMYNDIDSCQHHRFYYSDKIKDRVIEVGYSGVGQCVICGEVDNDDDICFSHEGQLVCPMCLELKTCPWCNEYIDYYEDERVFGNEVVCENCYEEHVVACQICEEEFLRDECNMILLYSNNQDIISKFEGLVYDSSPYTFYKKEKIIEFGSRFVAICSEHMEDIYKHLKNGKESVHKINYGYGSYYLGIPIEEIKDSEYFDKLWNIHPIYNEIPLISSICANQFDWIDQFHEHKWYIGESKITCVKEII